MTGLLDRAAQIFVALAVIELGMLLWLRGFRTPLGVPLTIVGALGFVAGAGIAALALNGRFGPALRLVTRVLVLGAALLTVKLIADRWPSARRRPARMVYPTSDSVAQALPVELRLRWAVRVAAHSVSTGGRTDSTLRIPLEWPYPPTVGIRIHESADSIALVAVDPPALTACRFTLFRLIPDKAALTTRGEPVQCSENANDSTAHTLRVVRIAGLTPDSATLEKTVVPTTRVAVVPWTQYRGDAARSGVAAPGTPGSAGWRLQLDGEVRATASLAGDRLFLGTHGPGALHVVDSRTGQLSWMRYLPNWVHQDAVSDGRTVVIGFGDNTTSLVGDAPSGVAAFDVATGALRWSTFEGNSVMASAVLWGDRAVSVTSAGLLRVRDVLTGAESARLAMRGRVTMAPPMLVGDTLIATLDTSRVCAVTLTTVTERWCTDLPGHGMLGHSAAAVIGGRVYLTAAVFNPRRPKKPWYVNWERLKNALGWYFGAEEYSAQRIYALDVATGRIIWESKSYPSQFPPAGHSSGTPVAEDGVGIVVLPLAGVTVGFDLATGAERWTQDTGPVRGPPAHIDGRVFLTLRSGELRVVRATTGAIECSIRTTTSFDRIGPVIAGGTLYLASTNGVLVALPVETLRRCSADEVRAIVR